MRTGKYYLGLIVVGILSAAVFGEIESSPKENLKESDVLLLGQPEPALKGIRQLYIFVHAPTNVAPVNGISFEELEKSAKEKINEAGIAIAESDVNKLEPNSIGARTVKLLKRKNENIQNLRFMDARTPELHIEVDSLDIKDSNEVVFYIKTSLAKLVYPGRDNRPGFKTDVWRAEPIMRAVSAEGVTAAVNSTVSEQVDAFIHAYTAANSPHKRPINTNINDVSKEQAEPTTETAPAEYEYVASKNSNVFHKSDCSSAKRIKPENLVHYSSRDEAIKAGKRPCSRCNP